jgi:hypothetical protein
MRTASLATVGLFAAALALSPAVGAADPYDDYKREPLGVLVVKKTHKGVEKKCLFFPDKGEKPLFTSYIKLEDVGRSGHKKLWCFFKDHRLFPVRFERNFDCKIVVLDKYGKPEDVAHSDHPTRWEQGYGKGKLSCHFKDDEDHDDKDHDDKDDGGPY